MNLTVNKLSTYMLSGYPPFSVFDVLQETRDNLSTNRSCLYM